MTDTLATHSWWEHYKEVVNSDDEMQVRGHDTFDTNFHVEIGDDRYLIEMDEGPAVDNAPLQGKELTLQGMAILIHPNGSLFFADSPVSWNAETSSPWSPTRMISKTLSKPIALSAKAATSANSSSFRRSLSRNRR